MKMLKHLFGKRDKELEVLSIKKIAKEAGAPYGCEEFYLKQTCVWRPDRIFGYFPDRTDRTGL